MIIFQLFIVIIIFELSMSQIFIILKYITYFKSWTKNIFYFWY